MGFGVWGLGFGVWGLGFGDGMVPGLPRITTEAKNQEDEFCLKDHGEDGLHVGA